jgi:hypothetical protein
VGAAPTSAKLQVAGSLGMAKGSEFFAGDDVVMELPKHDRPLVKYPEVAMTANSSGGYVASANSTYPGVSYEPYSGFNNIYTTDGDGWEPVGGAQYSTSTGAWIGGTGGNTEMTLTSGTTIYGQWLQLQMPQKIKLSYVDFAPKVVNGGIYDDLGIHRSPAAGYILGSNDGTSWTSLTNWTGYSSSQFTEGQFTRFNVNASVYYKYYRMVCTTTVGGTYGDYFTVQELEYYGHEEGDTSVDVVHRSIPNTPSPQHLEVFWDAADSNSYSFADSSNVYDLSGNGRKGTLTNNVTFDSVHNGWITTSTTASGITGSFSVSGGDWVHSVSYWVKVRALPPSSVDYLFGFATAAAYNSIAHYIKPDGTLVTGSWTLDYPTSDFTIPVGEWFHVTTTYQGGGFSPNVNAKTYINGELKHMGTNVSGGTNGTALGIPTSAQVVYLGYGYGGAATSPEATYGSFRMYNKALNADQVRELYEYDAPRFGHRQNVVALHKGNLGVGVAHPTSRFEVAGADGLQEYPPESMTAYETYIAGHGVFRSSESSKFNNDYPGFNAFNENITDPVPNISTYNSAPTQYNTSTGVYTGSNVTVAGSTTYSGDWVQLEIPNKIKLKSIHLASYATAISGRPPKTGVFLGSNNGHDWEYVYGLSGATTWPTDEYLSYDVNSSSYYSHFRFVVQEIQATNDGILAIQGIKYFGTPAPSSLEDGHLTLGKALTLPRVSGHPAGAETPRAESLVVHYDTTVDSVVSGSTVVDISGDGNNGTLTNGAAYSSTDRALTFDGVNDRITGTLNNPSGAWVNSVAFWFKRNVASGVSGYDYIYKSGISGGTSAMNIIITPTHELVWTIYNHTVFTPANTVVNDAWYHVVTVYRGGVVNLTSVDIYVNGVNIANSTNGTAAQTLPANADFVIANNTTSGYNFNGSISNFKIWGGVALTAEEVAMEYALGRTGKSLNLTDTSLCLGGTVPRAQLDVRGGAKFDRIHAIQNGNDSAVNASLKVCDYDGSNGWKIYAAKVNGNLYFDGTDYTAGTACIMTDDGVATTLNFTGQHRTFIKNTPFTKATELEGLIVSADNNKYIKMSGGIEAGSNAITTNESLPLVSLSNIAADKKCFGVISASEDPETRQEQYGNFVSVNRKEVGDTRVYINSVGEGAMWVTDTNGPLESGDYITTSNVAGYGQKQDSEFLANYTVAKITMDCDFNPQDQPIQRIKQSNVVETHYTGLVPVVKGVPHEWVTTTVTADDEWSNVSISPSDVTYAEWSNLEANVQNTYTLTYTQTSNVVYDVKYTKTTTANVTQSDPWDNVYVDPPNVSYEEWSNLEANVQNTYTLTYTMTTKVEATEAIYSNLSTEDKELFVPTYYQMVEQRVDAEYPGAVKHETVTDRLENVLDEHGQLQWEDHPTETEKAYKIRYLDASGAQTDEANAVHTAAFVGVTYHCG